MIELLILSFVAGILTVLAPCILPVLPVIVGGSSLHSGGDKKLSLKQPLTIIASLVFSIITFTLLLKFTTALLGIPAAVWQVIAGGIVLLFGINLLFPVLWEKFMASTGLIGQTSRLMGVSQGKTGVKKDILLGSALGPVFNSCSPTYALIVAVILPASFLAGLSYLAAYSVGLGMILLLISIFGRALVQRLGWMSNPHGVFQKAIGVLFVTTGLVVIFGIDKRIQTYVLDRGWYDPVMRIEQSFESK